MDEHETNPGAALAPQVAHNHDVPFVASPPQAVQRPVLPMPQMAKPVALDLEPRAPAHMRFESGTMRELMAYTKAWLAWDARQSK